MFVFLIFPLLAMLSVLLIFFFVHKTWEKHEASEKKKVFLCHWSHLILLAQPESIESEDDTQIH